METPPTVEINPVKRVSRRRRRNQVHWAFLPLVFLLGVGLGYLVWNKVPVPIAAVEPTQQSYKRFTIPIEDDPSLGPDNAPITLVMYSDYQCPFCRKWYDEVFKQLMADYQGKIRFVYKDFPLYGQHDLAAPSAEAAECAGDQGKYWEYQEKLFGMTNSLGNEAFQQYAADLKLDIPQFTECLSTHKFAQEIQADYDFASNLGVQSTPTFFVNGIPIIGAQSIDAFKSLIDQELAGKIPTS